MRTRIGVKDDLLTASEDYNYGYALGIAGRKEGKSLANLKNAYTNQNERFSEGLVEGYFSPKTGVLRMINKEN
jgi:hypothetical protein